MIIYWIYLSGGIKFSGHSDQGTSARLSFFKRVQYANDMTFVHINRLNQIDFYIIYKSQKTVCGQKPKGYRMKTSSAVKLGSTLVVKQETWYIDLENMTQT